MPDRLAWIDDEIKKLERDSLFRQMTTRESPPVAGMVQIDGRQFINFGSNDYLGIAASQELVVAVQNAVGQLGFGSGASPLVNGRGTLHRKLEEELAEFEATEAALIFPTGYAANVGTITSLVSSGDIVFSDQLNHASIIDGCRLSGATVCVFPHSDMDFLKEKLSNAKRFRRKLIVTDGLFSMDGDFARLDQLSDLAERFGSMIMVDEAHATGVFGEYGRGSCELFGVEDCVDVKVGTFSKAIGCVGGFVAGKRSLINWLFNKARMNVFSTALPEVFAVAANESLKLVTSQPQRRTALVENSKQLRDSLVDSGFEIENSESQIIPIIVGSNEKAMQLSSSLRKAGFFVPAIRPPSVPPGRARLRISLSSYHTGTQIEEFVCAVKSYH